MMAQCAILSQRFTIPLVSSGATLQPNHSTEENDCSCLFFQCVLGVFILRMMLRACKMGSFAQ